MYGFHGLYHRDITPVIEERTVGKWKIVQYSGRSETTKNRMMYKILPKALQTQALTVLPSNLVWFGRFGSVGMVCLVWFGWFSLSAYSA